MKFCNLIFRDMTHKLFVYAKRYSALLSAAMALTVVTGCASLQSTPQDKVRQLANQRWQYIVEGKFDKAYEMTVPSFRKLKTKENYTVTMLTANVKWQSGEVIKVECETQTCKVTIKAASQIMLPTRFKGPLVSGLDETWVFEEGQWWKLETL
jgi:hypothetical protein